MLGFVSWEETFEKRVAVQIGRILLSVHFTSILPSGQPVPPETTFVILNEGGGVEGDCGRAEAAAATARMGNASFILDGAVGSVEQVGRVFCGTGQSGRWPSLCAARNHEPKAPEPGGETRSRTQTCGLCSSIYRNYRQLSRLLRGRLACLVSLHLSTGYLLTGAGCRATNLVITPNTAYELQPPLSEKLPCSSKRLAVTGTSLGESR